MYSSSGEEVDSQVKIVMSDEENDVEEVYSRLYTCKIIYVIQILIRLPTRRGNKLPSTFCFQARQDSFTRFLQANKYIEFALDSILIL